MPITSPEEGWRLGTAVFTLLCPSHSLWDRGTGSIRFPNGFFKVKFPEQPQQILLEMITKLTLSPPCVFVTRATCTLIGSFAFSFGQLHTSQYQVSF